MSTVVFIFSVLALRFDVVTLIIATKNVSKPLDDAQQKVYNLYEQRLETRALDYVFSKKMSGTITLSNGETYVVKAKDLNTTFDGCDGYTIYTEGTQKAKIGENKYLTLKCKLL